MKALKNKKIGQSALGLLLHFTFGLTISLWKVSSISQKSKSEVYLVRCIYCKTFTTIDWINFLIYEVNLSITFTVQ